MYIRLKIVILGYCLGVFDQNFTWSKKGIYISVQNVLSELNRIALLRGYFLKRFRRYSLFALQEKLKRRTIMMNKKEKMNNRKRDKFVRYGEGATMYHMGLSKFMQLAKDAKACYKVGQLVLVNTEIIDEYLETLRVIDDDFYR